MFDFNLDESWKAVAVVLSEVSRTNCTKGVQELRDVWEQSKAGMFPYFDSNGRLDASIQEVLGNSSIALSAGVIREIFQEAIVPYIEKRNIDSQEKQLLIDLLWVLSSKFSVNELKNNRADNELRDPARPDKKLPAGTKISKYIISVVKHHKNAQLPKHSSIIEPAFSLLVDSLRGEKARIVVSINPLEMLLASDCTTGWSSCYGLKSGAHKTAPLALICDRTSAIAYSYNTTTHAYGFELPAKNWRQWLFFDFNNFGCIHNRQFPGSKPMVEQAARELTAQILKQVCHKPDAEIAVDYNREKNISQIYSNWVYSDPRSCVLYVSRGTKSDSLSSPMFKAGTDRVICPGCGKVREASENKGQILCDYCREKLRLRTCSICGGEHRAEELREINGDRYCPTCAATHLVTCKDCGQLVRRDSTREILNEEGVVCSTCARSTSAKYMICPVCGLAERKATAKKYSGGYICSQCISTRRAFVCDECGHGSTSKTSQWKEHKGKLYCPNCVSKLTKAGAFNVTEEEDEPNGETADSRLLAV